jgi:competence protein ComGC
MNKRGFTLLEMIVVISVIAVLFLLEIPNIQKVMNNVENKGCSAQLKVIDAAILEFKLEYNDYPDDMSDLENAGLISNEQNKCSNNERIVIVDGQSRLQ